MSFPESIKTLTLNVKSFVKCTTMGIFYSMFETFQCETTQVNYLIFDLLAQNKADLCVFLQNCACGIKCLLLMRFFLSVFHDSK